MQTPTQPVETGHRTDSKQGVDGLGAGAAVCPEVQLQRPRGEEQRGPGGIKTRSGGRTWICAVKGAKRTLMVELFDVKDGFASQSCLVILAPRSFFHSSTLLSN